MNQGYAAGKAAAAEPRQADSDIVDPVNQGDSAVPATTTR